MYRIIIIVSLSFFGVSNTLKFNIGNCPVLINESCSTISETFIKFTLSMKQQQQTGNISTMIYTLNPFNPKLPSVFNLSIPLKFIIHGYGGYNMDLSLKNITEAYQDIGYNVVIVDWEKLARLPCYATAFLNTWHVAKCLSVLIINLLPMGITPKHIHVVGFSLGAHISGLSGNNLKKSIGMTFNRITGLDPALPFFATMNNEWKLDKTDADFVDVIHTSAGIFGKLEPTGHVDFYVNGGSVQPSCKGTRYPPLCSHIMAGLYFTESIKSYVQNTKLFVAKKCDNLLQFVVKMCNDLQLYEIMGEYVNRKARGIYYLETSNKSPYALGYKPYYYPENEKKQKKFKLGNKLKYFLKHSTLLRIN